MDEVRRPEDVKSRREQQYRLAVNGATQSLLLPVPLSRAHTGAPGRRLQPFPVGRLTVGHRVTNGRCCHTGETATDDT